MAGFLRKVYDGFDTSNDIEPTAWREVLRSINEATVTGLSRSSYTSHEEEFLRAIRHSNEVFSAFKVHDMGQQMAARLIGEDGKLKPFAQWAEEVRPIASHHTGAWLRTEYDTAVIRAHNAADWKRFERDSDIYPNLRWMPTQSPDPESSHQRYWQQKLTLPVGHVFWNEHHPGDHWHCKCSLEQTDDPATPELIGQLPDERPQRGLENNMGKDGHTFSQNHPYFPDSCAQCSFYKPGLKGRLASVFRNRKKDCYNCPYIDKKMKEAADKVKKAMDVAPPDVETYVESHHGMVLCSPNHGANEIDENKRLAAFVADKLGSKVYLLPRLDPKNREEAALRHILLPSGVFENKNPDFYIGGLFYDGKSMMKVRKTNDKKKHHNDILNRIKSAKEQADNMIIEIPSFITRRTIAKTVNGYLSQSKRKRIIIVKHGNKCYVYQ